MKEKVLLRDVKEAEKVYAVALSRWGEKNQITIRAMIRYYDLKNKYKEQKKK